MFDIDPKIATFDAYNSPLVKDVWKKYFWPKNNEQHPEDVYARVANAIADPEESGNKGPTQEVFFELMQKRLFLPGGRILAGAGTDKRVTLMNCYANGTLEDSMEGIMQGVSYLALTSQQGGGMGSDFSPIRPMNAVLMRTQSAASGPLPFMDVFNQTGKTIRSAGERRAAQMGTICDTHPDLPAFIMAKGEGLKDGSKRFAEFNLSVLASDAFMAAVEDDADWPLYFHIPPVSRDLEVSKYDFEDEEGVTQYVYEMWKARDLWKLITQYTYEFSDPGIIFIDRINYFNNLQYCETIRCTNPCGEQPLPPHGTCNLGAINVANCITNPFTSRAEVNWELLASIVPWAVRFLDNVIEVTRYPLPEQEAEEKAKRRIGLGILGLGTAFAELGIRYGSQKSVEIAEQIMKTICTEAYKASCALAEEKGKFPLFKEEIVDGGFIDARFDDEMKELIINKGLRNGVLLTVAPVGTGSIALGNPSSGLEPDFSHEQERLVRSKNTEEFDSYIESSYTKRFYEYCTGKTFPLKADEDWTTTSLDLDILDHIKVQAAIQRWTDASTSKTINIAEDMPYDKFVEVYDMAYKYDLKGCTTYRPSEYRRSILTDTSKNAKGIVEYEKRPEELSGTTYKLKWHSMKASMYVTINYSDDKPYEIFFASKDAKFQDWMTGLTLMISAIFRSGVDPQFIPRELKQVVSAHDSGWVGGKFYGSMVARIGAIIEYDFTKKGIIPTTDQITENTVVVSADSSHPRGDLCPECRAPTLFHKEGCATCDSCGYSSCS